MQQSEDMPESGRQRKEPVAALRYAHGGSAVSRAAPRVGELSLQVRSEIGYSNNDMNRCAASGTVYLVE